MNTPTTRALLGTALAGVLLTGCSSAGNGPGPSGTGQVAGGGSGSAAGAGVGSATDSTATAGSRSAAAVSPSAKLDLQAHRGGAGENTENSIASFTHALELGVTTLEMDTQITKDGKVVVTHDNIVNSDVCADTAPASANDPQSPYVGKVVHELTLAQLETLDCGFQPRPDLPEQKATTGSKIPQLQQVFALVKAHKADVMMNIETKVDATARQQSAPIDEFVKVLDDQLKTSGLADQVTIQSFDWQTLVAMHKLDPTLPLVALTTGANLEVGMPGPSRWLGGLDIDDYDGDVAKAAAAIDGVTAISPTMADVTPDLISSAHAQKLAVIPWTVDAEDQMQRLIDLGVDGIITNYPTRLRSVMAADKLPLPPPFGAP